jgi:hypothetical protein
MFLKNYPEDSSSLINPVYEFELQLMLLRSHCSKAWLNNVQLIYLTKRNSSHRAPAWPKFSYTQKVQVQVQVIQKTTRMRPLGLVGLKFTLAIFRVLEIACTSMTSMVVSAQKHAWTQHQPAWNCLCL